MSQIYNIMTSIGLVQLITMDIPLKTSTYHKHTKRSSKHFIAPLKYTP